MRTFSLEEANLLLQVVEPLLLKAMESHQQLHAAQQDLQQTRQGVFLAGGSLLKVSELMSMQKKAEQANEGLREALLEINSMGVQVKDLEVGLIDFPCKVDDEIILLCWKRGEPSIGYWHSVEDGFQGRKPIGDRIAGAGPKLS